MTEGSSGLQGTFGNIWRHLCCPNSSPLPRPLPLSLSLSFSGAKHPAVYRMETFQRGITQSQPGVVCMPVALAQRRRRQQEGNVQDRLSYIVRHSLKKNQKMCQGGEKLAWFLSCYSLISFSQFAWKCFWESQKRPVFSGKSICTFSYVRWGQDPHRSLPSFKPIPQGLPLGLRIFTGVSKPLLNEDIRAE